MKRGLVTIAKKGKLKGAICLFHHCSTFEKKETKKGNKTRTWEITGKKEWPTDAR